MSGDASATVIPDVSVEAEDVDVIHARAVDRRIRDRASAHGRALGCTPLLRTRPERRGDQRDAAFGLMTVARLEDPAERTRACGTLLRSLPEWFGLEESIEAYERDVRELPTFAVREGDETVAFLTLKLHNEFSAEILVMAVQRGLHRQGLGRTLLIAAEDDLRAHGVEYLQVKTLGPSRPSRGYEATRRFYEACGFRPLEELARALVGHRPAVKKAPLMPLTVGTAGHIDHGKTWLVRALDGEGHGSAARGEGARDLDRPRLCAARASGRTPAVARRRARTRALRSHDDRGRDRDRPVPARDRRRRGRPAADARAPGDHPAARDRAGRRRGDEGGRGRRGDARACRRGGARARSRRRRRSRQREDRRRARRAASGAGRGRRPGRRRARGPAGAPPRRPRLHAARHRHGGDGDALVGLDRGRGRAAGRAGRPAGSRSQRAGARPAGRARTGRAARGGEPSRRRPGQSPSRPGADRSGRLSRQLPARRRRSTSCEPIKDGARLHVHHGTAEIPAVVRRIGDGAAQLRLSSPAVAARGDRVVLRGETTLGGGRVLDPSPPRHASAERIERIERGDVAATIYAPVRLADLRHVLDGDPAGVERAGDWVFSREWLRGAAGGARTTARRGRPARPRRPRAGRAVGGGSRAAARARAAGARSCTGRARRPRSASARRRLRSWRHGSGWSR